MRDPRPGDCSWLFDSDLNVKCVGVAAVAASLVRKSGVGEVPGACGPSLRRGGGGGAFGSLSPVLAMEPKLRRCLRTIKRGMATAKLVPMNWKDPFVS